MISVYRELSLFSKSSFPKVSQILVLLALSACVEVPSKVEPSPTPSASCVYYSARATSYYPDPSPMEGGFLDRKGKPLGTLQGYLAGKHEYVSVAMDATAFAYGTKVRIPELEKKYGKVIDFRVVDTGGAFKGKGTTRVDICTESRKTSFDPSVNAVVTLQVCQ